jgi:hypothetical protein
MLRAAIPCAAICAALLTAPAAASAQLLDSIPLNTRIRADVFTSETLRGRPRVQPLVGMLAGVRDRELLLVVRTGGDTLHLPRSSVNEVFISRGKEPRLLAALQRAVLPAVASAAFRAIYLNLYRKDRDPTPTTGALQAAAASGSVAAMLGFMSPRERWHRVPPTSAGSK